MHKSTYTFFSFILFFVPVFAQESTEKPIIDLDYEELKEIWVQGGDTYQDIYFDYHVSKAQQEGDTLEWANAYRYRAWSMNFEDGIKSVETAVAMANSIRDISQKEFSDFMSNACFDKAAISYLNYVDELAVESFIESYHWAKKSDNKYSQIIALTEIANVKAEYGQESEAILLQQNCLKYLELNKGKIKRWDKVYLNNLHNMARCYTYAKKADSAKFYITKTMEWAAKQVNYFDYEDMVVLDAQINYYNGFLEPARDTLKKYEKISEGSSKADKLFYLGKIEEKLGNPGLKAKNFKKYDSIMSSLSYPFFDNANEVYQFLLKDAIQSDNKRLEKKYFNRLVYYDSLLLGTQERLREITLKEFDMPLELEERNKLYQTVLSKNKRIQLFYVLCFVLVVSSAGYYLKYRSTKKKLAYVMANTIEAKISNVQVSHGNKGDSQVLLPILERLTHWEKELGFLEGSINQHDLAKILETNSTYLSQAINHYKGQNFANYLKDLRITYAINHLKEKPRLAKSMSMIQLAEHFGFSSTPVFAKALKKKIGVTPGVFIKQLHNEYGTS